jgi:hypothetical protein
MDQPPEDRFRHDFYNRRLRQVLLLIPFGPAVWIFMWMTRGGPDEWLGIERGAWIGASLLIVFACALFSLVNWRCPACGAYLGKRFSPRFCASCGARLH